MKTLFILFISLFVNVNCFAISKSDSIKTALIGEWQIENIVYTFTKDSLFIDEIDNEGDEYKYQISIDKSSNIILSAINNFEYGNIKFIIDKITDECMRLKVIESCIIDENTPEEELTFVLYKRK